MWKEQNLKYTRLSLVRKSIEHHGDSIHRIFIILGFQPKSLALIRGGCCRHSYSLCHHKRIYPCLCACQGHRRPNWFAINWKPLSNPQERCWAVSYLVQRIRSCFSNPAGQHSGSCHQFCCCCQGSLWTECTGPELKAWIIYIPQGMYAIVFTVSICFYKRRADKILDRLKHIRYDYWNITLQRVTEETQKGCCISSQQTICR